MDASKKKSRPFQRRGKGRSQDQASKRRAATKRWKKSEDNLLRELYAEWEALKDKNEVTEAEFADFAEPKLPGRSAEEIGSHWDRILNLRDSRLDRAQKRKVENLRHQSEFPHLRSFPSVRSLVSSQGRDLSHLRSLMRLIFLERDASFNNSRAAAVLSEYTDAEIETVMSSLQQDRWTMNRRSFHGKYRSYKLHSRLEKQIDPELLKHSQINPAVEEARTSFAEQYPEFTFLSNSDEANSGKEEELEEPAARNSRGSYHTLADSVSGGFVAGFFEQLQSGAVHLHLDCDEAAVDRTLADDSTNKDSTTTKRAKKQICPEHGLRIDLTDVTLPLDFPPHQMSDEEQRLYNAFVNNEREEENSGVSGSVSSNSMDVEETDSENREIRSFLVGKLQEAGSDGLSFRSLATAWMESSSGQMEVEQDWSSEKLPSTLLSPVPILSTSTNNEVLPAHITTILSSALRDLLNDRSVMLGYSSSEVVFALSKCASRFTLDVSKGDSPGSGESSGSGASAVYVDRVPVQVWRCLDGEIDSARVSLLQTLLIHAIRSHPGVSEEALAHRFDLLSVSELRFHLNTLVSSGDICRRQVDTSPPSLFSNSSTQSIRNFYLPVRETLVPNSLFGSRLVRDFTC